MKKITILSRLVILFLTTLGYSQTARLQVIHNCPDLAAQQVDVYVNGSILLNDFAFRTATPFVTVPAGLALSIDVAPGNSTSSAQSLYNLTTTLASNQRYIAVANGIVSTEGYLPLQPFALNVFATAREVASNAAQTDVLVNHGSPDAPTVDVVETSVPAGTIVNNISFPQFQGYLELANLNYTLDVRDASGSTTVASYLAPLQTLGLDGDAITVLASGFLNPAVNSDGPAFGLWVATAAGGNLIPLPLAPQTARLQVIHNCPDLAAQQVDVYVNGTILLNDFAFRTATPFVNVPAGVALSIDVAPGNSTSSAQSLYNLTTTLASNQRYIAVANGIVSTEGYLPLQPFALNVFATAREVSSNAAQTDVLVNHGSPDAPTVDVVETSVPAGTIVNNISFPQFQGYLELANLNYTLDVRDASGTTTVASYLAPLQTLGLDGDAITVLASGFLNPAVNSDGPAFGLWVATAAGGNLIPLPTAPLSTDNFNKKEISIFPNPATNFVNIEIPFDYVNSKTSIFDINGRLVLNSINSLENINLSGLTSGLYLLNIEIDDIIFNKKLFIKN